jgi:hypothetical protein
MDPQPIIDVVERLSPHAVIGDTEQAPRLALAVVPAGKALHDLQPYIDALLDAPRHIATTAPLTQIQSLVDYLLRFKRPDSVLFANDNPAKPSLFGIVDFHGQGADARAQFGHHCARYDFPISEQFAAWSGLSGKALSHVEMADHLSNRQHDIANPPLDWMQVDKATVELILHLLNIHDDQGSIDDAKPDEEPQDDGEDRYIPRSALYKLRQIRFGSAQRLLQMARTVEVSANDKAVEGYNAKTGERVITFEEEHETRSQGRKIIIPDGFLLRIPVFEGETPQLVPVRLQYRRSGQGVKWFMTLVEWQRVIRFSVKTEAERVQKATELPLFYGARSV